MFNLFVRNFEKRVVGLRALTKILSQDRKEVRKIWYPLGLIEKRSKRQSADKKYVYI